MFDVGRCIRDDHRPIVARGITMGHHSFSQNLHEKYAIVLFAQAVEQLSCGWLFAILCDRNLMLVPRGEGGFFGSTYLGGSWGRDMGREGDRGRVPLVSSRRWGVIDV